MIKIFDKINDKIYYMILYLIKFKFKLFNINCKIKMYYYCDDDYYLFVAYDKNNKIKNYTLYDFDYECIDIIKFMHQNEIECNNVKTLIDENFL